MPVTETLLGNETAVRLGFFFSILAVMAGWETVAPRRALSVSKAVRWYSNLGVVVLNSIIARLIFPLAPVAVALLAGDRGWGLLNMAAVPPWLAVASSVVLLDLAIYLQHVMFHAAPVLWLVHRMHHADLDFDVTTGARFHPIEIILSVVIKMAVVVLIGAPAAAVLIFEVLLNATAMFNHSNVRIWPALDRIIRLAVVTPDMHRVHHSTIPCETNSNFGFNLPWWDRLCGTYLDQPRRGHLDMTIGIDLFREPAELHLHRMLVQPLAASGGSGGGGGGYAINRRDWTSNSGKEET